MPCGVLGEKRCPLSTEAHALTKPSLEQSSESLLRLDMSRDAWWGVSNVLFVEEGLSGLDLVLSNAVAPTAGRFKWKKIMEWNEASSFPGEWTTWVAPDE